MIATEDEYIQGGRSLWKVLSMAEPSFTLGSKFRAVYIGYVFFHFLTSALTFPLRAFSQRSYLTESLPIEC